jgi:hypothetical protein
LQAGDKSEFTEKALTDGEIIQLLEADVMSSTELNITWIVLKAANLIEGFYLKYKQVGVDDYTIEKIGNNRQRTFVMKDLLKFTAYEILIEPYNGLIHGSESNLIQAKTKEDGKDRLVVSLETDQNI